MLTQRVRKIAQATRLGDVPRVIMGAVLIGLMGCSADTPTADRVASRVLRVGYAQEPPYAFADSTGRVTGLAPELLRAMQPTLGVDSVRFVLVEFERLLGELEAGRIDVIGAGLFITEERARRVRFTGPLTEVRGAVLLRTSDPVASRGNTAVPDASAAPVPRSVSVRALRGPIGVIAGAVEADVARAAGVPDSLLMRFPDVSTAVPALLAGELQALLLSEPSLRWLETRSLNRLVALLVDSTGDQIAGRPAFATRPDDAALAMRLDSALARVCAASRCDSLRRRFGFAGTP
mgnify:CR=1 FL=1